MDQPIKPVTVVLNALRVMEEVASRHPVGVSTLSRALGMPKSSVQRYLLTLQHAGWVTTADTETTKWQLSRKPLVVGLTGTPEADIRESAVRQMRILRDTTGETVHLSVPEGTHIVVIGRLDSTQVLRTSLPLGTRAALHASAMGRAMLAHMAPDEIERILASEHHRYTEHTLMDNDKILRELELTRQRGYAINVAGYREGIASIASAVFDDAGRPIAAISITMPNTRFEKADVPMLGQRVMAAAQLASGGQAN